MGVKIKEIDMKFPFMRVMKVAFIYWCIYLGRLFSFTLKLVETALLHNDLVKAISSPLIG